MFACPDETPQGINKRTPTAGLEIGYPVKLPDFLKKHIPATEQGSVAPYVLGWFLGVPSSLLFMIFLLRGCH